jgi:hypothetical protein
MAAYGANASAASGNLTVPFTKWVTTPEGAMAGVVDAAGTLGVFAGQVNAADVFDNGLTKLQATYGVTAGAISFSAEMTGQQNQHGRGVLNGQITTGDYAGARVHAEYQATPSDQCSASSEVPGAQGGVDGFCYIGVIRVMTRSAS